MIKYDENIRMTNSLEIIPRILHFDGSRPILAHKDTIFRFEEPQYSPPKSLLGLISQVAELRRQGQEVVSLAGGLPPKKRLEILWSTHFPSADARISKMIDTGQIQVESAAQYGSALGHEKLRSWAADDITRLTGRQTDASEILTTGGGLQYGLSAALLTLCASENKVAVTSQNTYSAFLEAAENPAEIPVFSVDTDEQGMLPEALDQSLTALKQKNINPGLVYAMAVSNPDGLIMSDERGKQLNEVCKRHNVPFFVDYAYYKLTLSHVNENRIPKVTYFDDNVILGFTTSKLGAPAERVGYMAIPDKTMYSKLRDLKQAQTINSAARPELAFWLLASSPNFDSTVQDLVKTYEEGITTGLDAVRKNGDIFQTDTPGGGMFLWVKVPDGISTYEVCGDILHKNHIAYSPGIWFQPGQIQFPDGEVLGSKPLDNYMRLCVVTETPDKVSETIDRLAQAFRVIAAKRGVQFFATASN